METNRRYLLILIAAGACLALGAYQGWRVLADRPKTIEVSQGTQIFVSLEQGVSSDKDNSGDTFRAQLYRPIEMDGKLLAPAGSEITGELSHVRESGRVEGRARMTLTLKQLRINGTDYGVSTRPVNFEAASSKKKDVEIITGSSVLGAIIGAIAGGGKGAAIGAGAGAGAGTGAVLYTRGKEVRFEPETKLAFRLTSPLELPIQRK